MNFGLKSIKRRIIFLSILLALLLFSSVFYTNQIVNNSTITSLNLVAEDQVLFEQLSILEKSLKEIERAIYQYSLLHENSLRKNLKILSDSLVYQADSLLEYPENNDADNTEVFRMPILSLRDTLLYIQYEVSEFVKVSESMETLYPAMPILRDVLYPINVSFMQAVELALDESERSQHDIEQREIATLLRNLRYEWAQQISSVRVFIANRLGAFGDPKQSMSINESNREIYSEGVSELLGKLEVYQQKSRFGIQQEDSYRIMKQAKIDYDLNFKKVEKIYLSENWRSDLKILRGEIRPLFTRAWNDVEIIQKRLKSISFDNVHTLVNTTGTLSDFIWFFAGFSYLLLILGYYVFEYSIRRPILQMAKAMHAYGDETEYTPKFIFNAEETNILLGAFSDMQEQVNSRQLRLESIVDNAGEGIITVNQDKQIETFNNAAKSLFGYQSDEIIGESIYKILSNSLSQEDAPFFERLFSSPGRANNKSIETTVLARRKDGETFPLAINVSKIRTESRLLYIAIVEDVSERQAMLDKLKKMAEHDALTGLHNRQYFMEELEKVVDRAARKSDLKVALLYIDLDNFKFVNDTLGHLAGDRVLIEVTELLNRRMRKSDLLGRIGGDEFAIILYEVDLNQAKQVADYYRRQLADYIFRYDRRTIDIGCSIGVAVLTADINNKEGLLARADVACQIAKRSGKNKVHVYLPDDRENMTSMREDMGWAKRIKRAIEYDQFVFACQPIMDVKSNKIFSYEVLLRMQDAKEKNILPAGFLPSAERFGLILDIDRWIIRNSIAELGRLRCNGLDIFYSINLSAKAVCDEETLSIITEAIEVNNVDPRAITFEITENTAIDNFDTAIVFLEALHNLGCFTALDDFGVGYSSFAYLKDLPVDYVKIDGSFVKNIESDALNMAMVKSMNEVAHAVGRKTVAEFVENKQGLEILRDIGVDYVQGYHIGKPLFARSYVTPMNLEANTV